MKRQPVKSSQLKSIAYDPATSTLEIEFVQGGSVYQYTQVTQATFDALMSAPSQGSYFIQNKKRSDLFPYKTVEDAAAKK